MNFNCFLFIILFSMVLIACKSTPVSVSEENYDHLFYKIEMDSFPIIKPPKYLHDNEYHYDILDTFSNPLERSVVLRDCIYKKYLGILEDSLDNNIIPDFIYNECLDVYKFQYCSLWTHHTQSLRYDLIKGLSDEDIEKLISLGYTELLNNKCLEKEVGLIYMDKSLFDLIELINKERNSNR